MSPRLSVLLPVRDAQTTLPRALQSLRWQTFREWEAVVVDDGSVDASPRLLRQIARQDPRFRLLERPREGLVEALNAGLQVCRGEYVARMDADDICHPDRFACQLQLLEVRPGITAVGCRVRIFPQRTLTPGMRRYQDWQNRLITAAAIQRDLFVESPLVHPSVTFRRRAVEAVGGYRDLGWPEDYDLWLRLWEAGGAFAKVPRVLFYWRDHPERRTRTHPCCRPEAFRRLKAQVLRRTYLGGGRRAVVWGAGPTGKRFARALRECGLEVAAFVDVHPRRIGRDIAGSPVLAPHQVGPGMPELVLLAVGRPAAREALRRTLRERGFRELRDFLCVA